MTDDEKKLLLALASANMKILVSMGTAPGLFSAQARATMMNDAKLLGELAEKVIQG